VPILGVICVKHFVMFLSGRSAYFGCHLCLSILWYFCLEKVPILGVIYVKAFCDVFV